MKKLTSLFILALIISLGLCGCSKDNKIEDESNQSSIKVGITMYYEYDPFTEDIRHNIEENLIRIGQVEGVDVDTTVAYSSKNQLVQNDQVKDFIDKDYDVICVNLVDRTDASVIIEKAKSSDTPIIFFNRELVPDDLMRFDKSYYVGARPEDSGRIQGELVLSAWEEKREKIDFNNDGVIQYVMLEGEAGHQDAIIRSRVSIDTITEGGVDVERLGDEIANWDRQQAHTKITSLLQGYPRQIELILANDDNMALGAVDALTEFGVQSMPVIVGVNGQEEALDEIARGRIQGTALNNANEKGRVIAEMAYGLGTEGVIPDDITLTDGKYYYVPYEKIDRDNVREYMN